MKINCVEYRKTSMSKEAYQKALEMIKKDKGYSCKIDGQPYYVGEVNVHRFSEMVEVTFVSINSLDFTHFIEIEEKDDETN